MSSLQGERFRGDQVSEDELQAKLDELKNGMIMAFNYAQGRILSWSDTQLFKCDLLGK